MELDSSDEQTACGKVAIASLVDVAFLGAQEVIKPDSPVEHHVYVVAGEDDEWARR
jgi:hypothetical protein